MHLLHLTVPKGKWKERMECLIFKVKVRKMDKGRRQKGQDILEKRGKTARRKMRDGKGGIGRVDVVRISS
jgi:hypothetical protein